MWKLNNLLKYSICSGLISIGISAVSPAGDASGELLSFDKVISESEQAAQVSGQNQGHEITIKSCEDVLKRHIKKSNHKSDYSSVWVGQYIQCEIPESMYDDVCLMRATFYPKNSALQKSVNYVVGLSSSGSSKVISAEKMKLKEKGPVVSLDLKPVTLSKKGQKVHIHRKKLQVVAADGNILSQCLSRSTTGDFLKF